MKNIEFKKEDLISLIKYMKKYQGITKHLTSEKILELWKRDKK